MARHSFFLSHWPSGMRSPIFLGILALAAVLGLSAGFASNYFAYSRHGSSFGPYSIDGDVTPANLPSVLNLDDNGEGARLTIVDGPMYDFGTMSVGDSGEHLFEVRNDGKSNLTLKIGESTCKCTLGNLEQNNLAPGESTQVKLSWVVKTSQDRFSQQAQLLTNDPNLGMIPLTIIGRVIREYEFEPKALTFGSVTPGELIDIETVLYNYSKNLIKITSSKITDPIIDELATIDITPLEKEEFGELHQTASQGFRIKLQVESGIPEGNVSQNLVIGFQRFDSEGELVPMEEMASVLTEDSEVEEELSVYLPLQGSVVSSIRMVTNSKLQRKNGGGYLFMLDRIPADKVTKATALILLKGDDRDDIQVAIQSVYPEGAITAKIGEVKRQKTMSLVPVEFEIDPKGESMNYYGLGDDDKSYGRIMLSTDKDNNASMALYLKFVTEDQ